MSEVLSLIGKNPEKMLQYMLDKLLSKPQKYKVFIKELNQEVDMIVYRAKLDPKDPEYYYCVAFKPCQK